MKALAFYFLILLATCHGCAPMANPDLSNSKDARLTLDQRIEGLSGKRSLLSNQILEAGIVIDLKRNELRRLEPAYLYASTEGANVLKAEEEVLNKHVSAAKLRAQVEQAERKVKQAERELQKANDDLEEARRQAGSSRVRRDEGKQLKVAELEQSVEYAMVKLKLAREELDALKLQLQELGHYVIPDDQLEEKLTKHAEEKRKHDAVIAKYQRKQDEIDVLTKEKESAETELTDVRKDLGELQKAHPTAKIRVENTDEEAQTKIRTSLLEKKQRETEKTLTEVGKVLALKEEEFEKTKEKYDAKFVMMDEERKRIEEEIAHLKNIENKEIPELERVESMWRAKADAIKMLIQEAQFMSEPAKTTRIAQLNEELDDTLEEVESTKNDITRLYQEIESNLHIQHELKKTNVENRRLATEQFQKENKELEQIRALAEDAKKNVDLVKKELQGSSEPDLTPEQAKDVELTKQKTDLLSKISQTDLQIQYKEAEIGQFEKDYKKAVVRSKITPSTLMPEEDEKNVRVRLSYEAAKYSLEQVKENLALSELELSAAKRPNEDESR
ncbi:hypothetical protein QR680_014478 [Steinernema hermaphroditum]|uniref:Uncharacterized protein n=1 Tax=Steinernema hermaphroditum TaxID=289476 RepID=A0AA39IBL3_9BILA|nr:hypothetical protein QR680_014478 [Steinernema hermaphroditum]